MTGKIVSRRVCENITELYLEGVRCTQGYVAKKLSENFRCRQMALFIFYLT